MIVALFTILMDIDDVNLDETELSYRYDLSDFDEMQLFRRETQVALKNAPPNITKTALADRIDNLVESNRFDFHASDMDLIATNNKNWALYISVFGYA